MSTTLSRRRFLHMAIRSGVAFAAILSLPPLPARADSTTPTAIQILDRYIAVTGGKAAYQKITSTVTTGTFSIAAQKINGTFETRTKVPDKVYAIQNIEGVGKVEQGFNGKTGWSRDPVFGTRILSGVELAQLKAQAQLNVAPLNAKSFYTKMELVGVKMVNDAKTYEVRLTPSIGNPITQYYDVKTNLLTRQDQIAESPQGSIPTESYFSDWRLVDGIKQPFTIKQVLGGAAELILTTSSVKNNIDIPDSVFTPPLAAPAKPKK